MGTRLCPLGRVAGVRATMMSYSRRDFAKLALAGIPLVRSLGAINSTISGVRMGVQSASFTFSGIGVDGIIRTLNDVGLAEIDVMSEHIENYLGGPVQLPGTGRPGPWARGNAPRQGSAAGTTPGGRRGAGASSEAREALRKWRVEVGLEKFRDVGRKFADGGIRFYSYNLSFNDSFTDEEIDKG